MPRPGEVRQPRLALCLGLVAVAAACCTRSATAVPAARGSDSGDTAAAPFACGSSGDAAADSTQVISLFSAAKSVCCDDLGEQCEEGKPLPETCSTAGCARAVSLVKQSCAAAFASDGFLGTAFGPSLAAVLGVRFPIFPRRYTYIFLERLSARVLPFFWNIWKICSAHTG